MRKSFVLAMLLAGATSAAAFAQQGSTPAGPSPDLSKSDMGTHDTATMPNNLDLIRNGIRNSDIDRTADELRKKLGPARPAKAAELIPGAPVSDKSGTAMATIVSIDADGVVVSTGTAKVKVPIDAFGHNKAGLLLDMSKAQFLQIVAKANGAS